MKITQIDFPRARKEVASRPPDSFHAMIRATQTNPRMIKGVSSSSPDAPRRAFQRVSFLLLFLFIHRI